MSGRGVVLAIVAVLAMLARIRVTVTPPGASFPALAGLLVLVAAAAVAFAAVIVVRLMREGWSV
jgi:hypothetical protein